MPFTRPTLTDLRARVGSDVGAGALLRVSNLGVMARAQAGLAHGHYGYLDWIARQAVPFTAEGEYLEGWAALKGVTRKPATAATGTATFTATDGATVPKGTEMTRSDGIVYRTTAETTASGTSITVPVAAETTGATTNADAGVALTLSTGVSGVSSSGVFAAAATGGADVEGDDSLRSRMLAVYAAPPAGGSPSDFKSWATAVAGVTRAWVVPGGMGVGTVLVYFMMDDAQAANGGFPQGSNGVADQDTRDVAATGDQLALANALFAEAPVPALIYAAAPTVNSLRITIAGLATAKAGVKNAVKAAIVAALLRNAVPGGTTSLSAIEGAIAAVSGADGFVITSITCTAGSLSRADVGNIISSAGALPLLGSIAWAA